MKNAPTIRVLLIFLISVIIPMIGSAQVLHWQGQSPYWNDLENWHQENGMPARALPNENTHVIIPLEYSGSIIFHNQKNQVASFTALGFETISLESNQNSTLSVNGSLSLGENCTISPNLEIELNGLAYESPSLTIPSQLNDRFDKIPDNYSILPSSGGNRGACPFFDLVPDPTPPTCNGFENGIAAVLEPTTGTGPYSYQWIGGPETREWTNLGAGTYTVIVLDLGQGALPCNIDVFVNEPGPLSLFSLSQTPPTCADLCDGQASPIVIGGNGGYDLSWSSGESGLSASALCATFTLNIEDSEGCIADTNVTFANIPDPVLINEVITDITCFGADDGIIDLSASGGTGTLDFSWTGPNGFNSISEDISNLEPGDYTVGVSDDNGCLTEETFTISENPVLLVSANATDNLCNGDNTGAIDLTISGGLAPYDVSWTGPSGFVSAAQNIADLIAGTYEATITDAANCVLVIQETVDQPTPLTADITPTELLCFEDNSGQLTAVAQGGTPGYNYSWVGPNGFFGSGPTIIALPAGTYTLTVTDNNSCVFTTDVELVQPDELILNFVETPISCNGDSDGEIDLNVSGGTSPFTFSWTGPGGFTSADEDISGLTTGTYTVEVTDLNNCTIEDSFDLTEPLIIDLSASVTDPNCSAGSTGAIDLTIANGTPPYNVSWAGPGGYSSTDEDITGLVAGDYTVTAGDAGGCTATQTFTVTAPSGLNATFDLTPVTCFAGNNGSIVTTPTGGTAPYTFLWLGPDGFFSTDQNINGLVAGDYSLLLTDVNGCNAFFSLTITQPSNLSVSNTISNVSCFGGSNGSINITPTGASSPYSYSWTGPDGFVASSRNISGLEAGDYTVLITDVNNCTFNFTYSVDEPDQIVIDASVTDVACSGDFTGAIDATISGGSPLFTRSWSGPGGFTAITEDINGLEAGSYTISVTDSRGCIASETFAVQELFNVAVSSAASDISCFGAGDGTIDVTPSGGLDPYTFDWTGPDGFTSSSEDLTELEAGVYDVTVLDANGCQGAAQVEIIEPAEISVVFTETNIDCFGAADGAVTLSTSGGTAPLDFTWTGPDGFVSENQNLSGLEPGDYEVTVEDVNGCSVTDAVTISENSELTVSVETFDSNCLQFDGLAVASAFGGTGLLTYVWEDESGVELVENDSLIDVQAGTYQVVVTDELGCSVQATAVISDSNGTVTGIVTNPTCFGGSDGAIDPQLTGGTAPFDYQWTGDNGFTSNQENLSNLSAGTYVLAITDVNNCVFSETYEVVNPPAITVVANFSGVSCLGSDATIGLSIENAASPVDVGWNGPNGFTGSGLSLTDLESGDYDYVIMDALGCSTSGTVSIPPAESISITEVITDINCAGGADGAIDIEISGGTSPLQFSWTGPDGFSSIDEDITDLSPGEYTVTVTDQFTCTESLILEVNEPDSILVDFTISQPDCNQSNGSIEALITGGTIASDYQIAWEDQAGALISNSALIDNLPSGTYGLTVTDDNGCIFEEEIFLSNPGGDITAIITPESCNGAMDGSIDLEIGSVAEPYSVDWMGPNTFTSTDEDIDGLEGGNYTYTISGADGCDFSESLEVVSPDAIAVVETIVNTCFDAAEGIIEIAVSGGEEPYTISWVGPDAFTSSDLTISNLIQGDYNLEVVDNAGCTFSQIYSVTASPEIIRETNSEDITCFGESNGSIDLTLAGGLAPFTIEWLGPDGFVSDQEELSGLSEGEYTLTATDLNGCFIQDTISIAEPEELAVLEDVTDSGCDDEANSGAISLNPQGGQPDYTISWTGPDGFVSSALSISNLAPGVYNYSVMDENSCEVSGEIEIISVDPLAFESNLIEPDCFGASTGGIETVISGGVPPYDVSWTGPNAFVGVGDTINNIQEGDYNLNVTDQAGCELRQSITLGQPEAISLSLAGAAATCINVADGSIEVTATGGTPGYTFSWTGPDGFESDQGSITSLFQGEYILTLTDVNDCEESDTANVEILFDLDVNAGLDTALCPSELPVLLNGSLTGGDAFYWTLGGDTLSSTSEITINDTFEGVTDLILIGSNGACSETDTLSVEILDSPDVDGGDDLRVFIEEVFTLGGAPTSTDEVTYLWMPNPMSVFDSTSANPTGFLLESEDFVVTATDVNGCQSSDTVFVEVLPDLEVTSGFTPNGDGANDTWIIDNIELFPSMVVHVFNRWGVEVFESQGYNSQIAWDGTYNGSVLPSGTYYFTIELNDPRFPDPITGPLTLHR